MKLKNNIVHYALAVAVIFSIALSATLWVNPTYLQSTDRNSQSSQKSNSSNNDEAKTVLGDIYQPTVIDFNNGNQTMRLASSKVDLMQEIRHDLGSWKVSSVSDVKKLSRQRYENFLRSENMVLLVFPDKVAPKDLTDIFKDIPKKIQNKKFNRVAIDLKKKSSVYLLNDNNYEVTDLSLKNGKYTNLKKIVSSDDTQQMPVSLKRFDGKYINFYTNKIQIPQYSYLVNKDSASIFVTRLLGTSNSSVNSRKEDQQTVYFDNAGQRLAVENKTGVINYSNYSHEVGKDSTLSDNLNQGFRQLEETGRLLDDVRYDEYDPASQQITYRSYINAFPILADNNYGTYQIRLASAGGEQTNFSLYSLQVPVPSKQQSVELPATQDVLNDLSQAGIDLKKIKGIRIGYKAQLNDTSKQVVDLVPAYFILYNGSWIDQQTILSGKVS